MDMQDLHSVLVSSEKDVRREMRVGEVEIYSILEELLPSRSSKIVVTLLGGPS